MVAAMFEMQQQLKPDGGCGPDGRPHPLEPAMLPALKTAFKHLHELTIGLLTATDCLVQLLVDAGTTRAMHAASHILGPGGLDRMLLLVQHLKTLIELLDEAYQLSPTGKQPLVMLWTLLPVMQVCRLGPGCAA